MDIDIYIYSDESGVFDYVHNDYFVFGGLIVLGKKDKDKLIRKYKAAEKAIAPKYPEGIELKASRISNDHRAKLFRSLNQSCKFGVVIEQKRIRRKEIFANKKSKQRYLDYAYKIGVKNALIQMMQQGLFLSEDVHLIRVYVDEHTTATDGIYELREALLQEFKEGTFNYDYRIFFKPIFPSMQGLELAYCNSSTNPLVRASDVIANRIYHEVISGNDPKIRDNLFITKLP